MLSPSTPLGAFTNQTVAAINAALVQAGLAATTGKVFYCDPVNGLDTNDGQSPASAGPGLSGPVQTLGAGYNLLRSGYNDVLVLIGNGQSSGSARIHATFTWAKNAAHLIGVCAPSAISQRARIANGTADAAFANFFVISGNGCLFQNVSWFQGFAAGVVAEILMTITGQRNAFINCDFEGMGDATGATDPGSRCILIKGGGGENYFGHCNVGLDTVVRTGANASVELQNNSTRNYFEDCTFLFWSSDGLQYAVYVGASGMDRWLLFKSCLFIAAMAQGGLFPADAIAQLFNLNASPGGIIIMDPTTARINVTIIGDAATLARTWNCAETCVKDGGKAVVGT